MKRLPRGTKLVRSMIGTVALGVGLVVSTVASTGLASAQDVRATPSCSMLTTAQVNATLGQHFTSGPIAIGPTCNWGVVASGKWANLVFYAETNSMFDAEYALTKAHPAALQKVLNDFKYPAYASPIFGPQSKTTLLYVKVGKDVVSIGGPAPLASIEKLMKIVLAKL